MSDLGAGEDRVISGLIQIFRTYATRTSILIIAALMVSAPLVSASLAAEAPPLSEQDIALYTKAFASADKKKWKKAHKLAEKAHNSLPAKVIDWLHLSQPRTNRTFAEITAFMAANPKWPRMDRLQRRAEESIHPSDDQEKVLVWLEKRHQITSDGKMAFARALMTAGRKDEAIKAAKVAWVEGNFGSRQERQFYRLFKKYLAKSDHNARLDRLLWDRQVRSARRMLRRVDKGHKNLAQARILLMTQRGNVDRAIRRVPKALQDDPGLIFERLRWRRRKKMWVAAMEFLDHPNANKVRPALWWRERSVLTRKALQMGYISQAYDIARKHGMTSGAKFADAEWLAGWIALRFLKDSEAAYTHFKTLYNGVKYPISKARGAYWAGRAAEANGSGKLAPEWYKTASNNVAIFYGQLAAGRSGLNQKWPLPNDPLPSRADIRTFSRQELVEVVRLLGLLGQHDHMRWFIYQLNQAAKTPGQRALTASLASLHGRRDMAVWIARKAYQQNIPMVTSGYPAPKLATAEPPELALTLAIIRQESNFNPTAISRVGARGLMQIMPRTAKRVAKTIHVKYSKKKLTDNPDYNVRLGTAYIQKLIDRYKGSYILAVAAYNAGDYRVDRWMREFGDPREADVDAVDWMEMIPYAETRNYVHRVLEGLQVYRRLLGRTDLSLSLSGDLARSAVPALAKAAP